MQLAEPIVPRRAVMKSEKLVCLWFLGMVFLPEEFFAPFSEQRDWLLRQVFALDHFEGFILPFEINVRLFLFNVEEKPGY
jgi:hypothetical protein